MTDFAEVRKSKRVEAENHKRTEQKRYRARYRSAIMKLIFCSVIFSGYSYLRGKR